jgi:hypothetical protein
VFGWAVAIVKIVVSCGIWKNCCGKAVVGKAEDRLVRRAVSCGKLYAVDKIHVILLKVCGTIYIPKYSYKPNMFTILMYLLGRKILNFLNFSSIWST